MKWKQVFGFDLKGWVGLGVCELKEELDFNLRQRTKRKSVGMRYGGS